MGSGIRVVALLALAAAGVAVAFAVVGSPRSAAASEKRASAPSVSLSIDEVGFFEVGVDESFTGLESNFTAHLEYGPTPSYGSTCCDESLAGGTPGHSFVVPGFADGSSYHMRLVVSDGASTYESNDVSFTTLTSGKPGIDFYNPVPAAYDSASGCFEGGLQIATRGLDSTWYAAAGTNLANPVTSSPETVTGYPWGDIWLNGGDLSLTLCVPPQPPGTLIYLQLHASNARGDAVTPVVTYTAATTTSPTTTAGTTTTQPPPDEIRPTMSSTTLPAATVGRPYKVALPIENGSPPYTVALNGPDARMPPGLTLEGNGVVDGTPTSAGQSVVNIEVFDQRYPPPTGPASVFTLTIPINEPTTTVVTTTSTTTTAKARTAAKVGHTVRLARRTRASGCRRSALPDRRCSPGAYYSRLTKAVICSPTFRPASIGSVPIRWKHAVETEYGMRARSYGRGVKIDHIIPVALGGSNDIANLFPERGSTHAGYHEKDKLEGKLHAMVCVGKITLAAARRGIAANWETLYARVFHAHP